MSISPSGEIFVACLQSRRLVSFKNGHGTVVCEDVKGLNNVFCAQNCVIYLLTHGGRAVQMLNGSNLQAAIHSDDLAGELQFEALHIFVTKEEVLYISDRHNNRILCLSPDESQSVIAWEVPEKQVWGLFVAEGGKIYVAGASRKVWCFNPGDRTCHEVLQCLDGEKVISVLPHGRSLYVSTQIGKARGAVYEYFLPPELQLEVRNPSFR
ncbi:unnamed protein product [Effrenium voratum]|nr:unnamed protein product [Effrenium voratum]